MLSSFIPDSEANKKNSVFLKQKDYWLKMIPVITESQININD